MRKYRILTDGKNFKASILYWFMFIPLWCILQDGDGDDVIYKSYNDAEKDAIRYIDDLDKKNKKWIVVR